MDWNALLYALGLSGVFASRAFVPAFFTSVTLAYGDQVPLLNQIDFIERLSVAPTWLTEPWVMATLGVLSLLEIFADKNPDLRAMMAHLHGYMKSGLAALTTAGVITATQAVEIQGIVAQASFLDYLPMLASGGLTFITTQAREGLFGLLRDADSDDSTGVQGLLSWFDDLWAIFGVYFLMIFPVLVAMLVGMVYAALWGMGKYFERRAEKRRVPCPDCGEMIHACAPYCPKCGAKQPAPKAVGLFGGPLDVAADDLELHAVRLASKRRCPRCATKLPKKSVAQRCEADDWPVFGDAGFRERYLAEIDGRLGRVMLISFLWGLIPVVGLIVGVVYGRFALVGPYGRYLSLSQGCLARLFARALFLVFALVQAFVPVLGALTVPLLVFLGWQTTRRPFVQSLDKLSEA